MLETYRNILIIAFVASVLPACSGSGGENGFPTPLPVTLRANICDTISNTHRCARAIEARQLRASEGINRTERGLCSELPSEWCIPDDSDFAYSYLGTLDRPAYHVLWAQYVEGNRILLVQVSTGSRFWVDAMPVPSPSGRFLAVASADLLAQYNPNRLTILEAVDDSLIVLWSNEPERWGPATAWWTSDFRLKVETIVLDTLRFEEVIDDTVVVERPDGQWRLMPKKRSS